MHLNFPLALKAAAGLLDKLADAENNSSAELRSEIDQFMGSEEACRGFFVVLLSDDRTIADNPPDALLEALTEGGEIPVSVLTRNLVMSTATQIVHLRNVDNDSAAGSERVVRRTKELIRRAGSEPLTKSLMAMRATLAGDSQEFAPFMARTNYDEEQKSAAIMVIDDLLGN